MRELIAFVSITSTLSLAVLSHWLHWPTAQQVIWTMTAILDAGVFAAAFTYHQRRCRP